MSLTTLCYYNTNQAGGNQKVRATSPPLTTRDATGGSPACDRPSAKAEIKGHPTESLDGSKVGVPTSVHTEARSVNDDLVRLLDEAGYRDLAESVMVCHASFRTLVCEKGHAFNPIPEHQCWFRLCIHCARTRQRKAHGRIFPKLKELSRLHPGDRWVMITLTVKSSPDGLDQIVKEFKMSFARLRRRSMWKQCIRAGVAGYEITFNPDQGWHFHCHILALRKEWLPQDELSREWEIANRGAGYIVDIRAITNLHEGLNEVLKYVFKPSEIDKWTVQQLKEFLTLKRVKLSESYGELRGLAVEDDQDLVAEAEIVDVYSGGPCPTCGEVLSSVSLSVAVLREMRRVNTS